MGNSDSSDNGRITKSRFEKLSRHNWAVWKARFMNVIVAKGYKNLMDLEWVKANKKTPEYRKMSAWTMNKLYKLVKEELHPVIMSSEQDIYNAMENLANACGEKSIIRLCNKLFSLLNCSYVPGASLAEHLISFRKNYTALKTSIVSNPGFMTVSTGLAAALLLRSLHQDDSLNSLVQSLYNIKPLTFEKMYDRLLIEETRKESATAETTYYSMGHQLVEIFVVLLRPVRLQENQMRKWTTNYTEDQEAEEEYADVVEED
ncbi:hypothetical protein VP01_5709g1, partial [Puccinia sorghi]